MNPTRPTGLAVGRTMGIVVTIATLVISAACGTTPPAEPAAEEAPVEAAAVAPLGDQLDISLFRQGSSAMTLVPSPRELQAALGAAGLETTLSTLVPARTWKPDAKDPDRVAVRTGVIIADLLLTVKTAKDEEMIGRLASIQDGMKTLDGGSDIDATIQDLMDRIKAGAVDRDALLSELDELSQVAVPELEFHGKKRIVPLIKAGSWLAGAHLVAEAAKKDDKPAASSGILKQPEVVSYFQGYTKAEEGKVSSEVAQQLETSLAQLETVAKKEGPLAATDVDTVATATHAVMELL